jgi:hypothetical protein
VNGCAKTRCKWLAGTLLVLASGGCITYTGDYYTGGYADDGYYGSPDRGTAYSSGYYGDYYYSAVPAINISYSLFFGYPYSSYAGCGYWSPYCGWWYPGYGYGYGYGSGFGFGWGHGPYYGHQPHHHHPKPKPKHKPPHVTPPPPEQPPGQAIVKRPTRVLPEYTTRPVKAQRIPAVTQPVSTGTPSESIVTAPMAGAIPKTTYWRIPANRRQAVPVSGRGTLPARDVNARPEIPSPQPVRREFVRLDADAAPVTRIAERGTVPVLANKPAPAADAGRDSPQMAPERAPRPVVRDPKPSREKPARKASVSEDADP